MSLKDDNIIPIRKSVFEDKLRTIEDAYNMLEEAETLLKWCIEGAYDSPIKESLEKLQDRLTQVRNKLRQQA